jgi:hypothetical protein
MAQHIQSANGTATAWTSANSVLMLGEIGVETDTLKLKVGDGVTPWNSLAYVVSGSGGGGGGGAVSSVQGRTGAVVITKADVGLGNVDNTSNATERATVRTLTNATINGTNNTLSNLPAGGIAGVIPIANLATGTPNGAKFIRDDGTLQSPPGTGTVTATAGALTANALMLGAAGVDSKVVAGIVSDGTSKLTLGVAGASAGGLTFNNATSGSIVIAVPTGALGSRTLTLPIGTDTLVGKATVDQLTNKDLNGATVSGITTVTGAMVAAGTASASAIDFTKPQNDFTVTGNVTHTVTGSPVTGQSTLCKYIGDTVDRTITMPAGTWRSDLKQATITTFVLPANQTRYVTYLKTAAGYDSFGEPQPLQPVAWNRTQSTGTNETKTICAYATRSGRITGIYGKTSSGTIVVQATINGTNVTGGSCTAATTRASGTPSAAFTVAVGDVIGLVYSSNSGAANTDVTIAFTPDQL